MAASARSGAVLRTLWIILACNLGMAAVKLAVGLSSASLAVIADGFDSLVDSSGNIVGLIGLWVAARPADENHPYGHQRYEAIATMSIGALLIVAALEVGRGVLERLLGASPAPRVTTAAIVATGLTFVVRLGIAIFEARAGKRHIEAFVLTRD